MPRLDARWDNFWERGQVWYRFGLDGRPFVIDGSVTASAVISAPALSSLTAHAIIFRAQIDSASLDAVISAVFAGSVLNGFAADAFIVNPHRSQHDRGDGPASRSPHYDTDLDRVITLSKALGVYAEGQDLHTVLQGIVARVADLESQ